MGTFTRNPILLILLLALALRLALWAQPLHEPANDETEYVTVAYDLLEGRGWQFYTHYHWLRAPLYPLFLAGSLWLTNGDLHLAALPNVLLSVATVYLVYALTRELLPTQRKPHCYAPLIAALFAALLFTLNTFASLYMGETLFTFLFSFALLLLVRWHHRAAGEAHWHILVLAGVLYGLATLTRSVSLAFLPVVLAWITFAKHKTRSTKCKPQSTKRKMSGQPGNAHNGDTEARSVTESVQEIPDRDAETQRRRDAEIEQEVPDKTTEPQKGRELGKKEDGFCPKLLPGSVSLCLRGELVREIHLLPALLFAGCMLLTIAPWTIRNCHAYGRCILVETGLSYNLWAFSEPREDMGEIFRVLENIPNPAVRADEASRRGLERLQEDPAILLRKLYPNWVALWRVKPIQDRFLLPNYYTDPPPLVFLAALLFDDALYVIVLVAGVVGGYRALLQSQTRRTTLLLALWLLYIVATTMLTHGEGRYRHFVFPVLLPYAALLLVSVWDRLPLSKSDRNAETQRRRDAEIRQEEEPSPVQNSCTDSVSSCLCGENLPVLASPLLRVTVHIALVVLCVGLVQTVWRFYPWEWAIGGAERSIHRLAGDVALAMGNEDAAETAYIRAYHAQKTADGRIILGNLYRHQGRMDEALAAYESAWDRRRRYMAANASVGDMLRLLGREDEARDAFEGYFVAEQQVTDWSWENLSPPPTAGIDVGGGLDFGYVGGVYNAEVQQGATARWTNGQGLVRVAGGGGEPPSLAPNPLLVRLRLAAPHPGREQVPVQVCCEGVCQPVIARRTWRLVSLIIPAGEDAACDVVLHSPTFMGADGREVGVLLDRVWVQGYTP